MISIIGAGMAGLLAAGILRSEADCIVEAQKSLPNNHTALLRFRSSTVGDALNIPFKRVQVMKAVEGTMNPVAAALSYSIKTNGTARLRSSTTANGEIEERFIAPEDLVQQMANRVTCQIHYGTSWLGPNDNARKANLNYISTLPMPVLMSILGWNDVPTFDYVPGYNINCRLTNVDAYATVYLPDMVRGENRISLTGDRLTIEVALPKVLPNQIDIDERVKLLKDNGYDLDIVLDSAMQTLGLWGSVKVVPESISVHKQKYAKILPIDESIRRNFIVWASEKHNVYSLGRFATWRPGLLLDDVVKDVRVIQGLVRGAGSYEHRKKGLD